MIHAQTGTPPFSSGSSTSPPITMISSSEEDSEETGDEEVKEVTEANGGDITSSTSGEGVEGSTAPLTGVLLDEETGEAKKGEEDDDSPY